MKNNYLKIMSTTILVGAFLFLAFGCDKLNKSQESSTTSNTTYEQPIKAEPEKTVCHYCKGTGIITCSFCKGTGVNNSGEPCGCVLSVENDIAMGRQPRRTARSWTCEMCNGTGYPTH
jgi:hypothetical protein